MRFFEKRKEKIELSTDKSFLKEVNDFIENGKKTVKHKDKTIVEEYNIILGKKVRPRFIAEKHRKEFEEKMKDIKPRKTISWMDSKNIKAKDLKNIPKKCVFCKKELKDFTIKEFNYSKYEGPLALMMTNGICIFCSACGKPTAYYNKISLLS